MEFVFFLVGAAVGAVGGVIFYRRKIAEVEAAIADAVAARKRIEDLYTELVNKVK